MIVPTKTALGASTEEPNLDAVELKMLNALQQTIKVLTQSGGLSMITNAHSLNGAFKQLLDKKLMSQLLFPGTDEHTLCFLPKDLKGVLEWKELNLDLTRIAKSAAVVLGNIKISGAKQADIMDDATESALIPQIVQEALGKGIIENVRDLNRVLSNINSKINLSVASVSAKEASYDQLDGDVIVPLKDSINHKYTVQQEFMGEEWEQLILSDVTRFARSQSMTSVNTSGEVVVGNNNKASSSCARMAWIEPSTFLSETYPAIAELVQQLHALPYEINSKWGEDSKLKLCEPTRGCTMLVHYPIGSGQKPRMDSCDNGGPLDSGMRMTCSYHISSSDLKSTGSIDTPPPSVFGKVLDSEQPSKDVTDNYLIFFDSLEKSRVPVKSDMLTIHHSSLAKNERVVVQDCEYFVVLFFVLGRDD